jgi:4-hydroxy-3-methylbut-2-enyl diphosphate reductase
MALEIRLADQLGFCFGVQRAIVMVEEAAGSRERIDSLGSIVHNPVVAERLREQRIEIVKEVEEASAATVAITAHGAGPEIYRKAGDAGREIIDTTCPIVAKAQRAARRLVDAGFQVIVYGDANHPEVRGVVAWTRGRGIVLASAEEPVELPRRKVALLSQTTKSQQSFTHFVSEFLARHIDRINEVRIFNTTCPETEDRYEAARRLAPDVDLMIVIGGRKSANTGKLAAACREAGAPTCQIEQEDDLEARWLDNVRVVGVTAGASTPNESIAGVVRRLCELDQARTAGG